MALVYRAHFVFITNPIRNSKGVNTSAAYGFTNTLIDLLTNRKPTHLAVVFDTSAPTDRHIKYPEYKAQREEMPEELSAAIPVVKELVKAFNLPCLELDGYEADDIIGTLAKQAETQGFDTYMVTPDKDFGQLVDEHTFMYRPGRKGGEVEILGIPEVCEKWGIIRPDQVIDCLGMIGDSVDNIPGIPGIGPKTAQKLIAEFDTLENLLKNTDKLKGKQKEKVEANAEQALLSKDLATINTSVPLDHAPEDLLIGSVDEVALKALFIEQEFNTLGKRVFGTDFHAGHGAATTTAKKTKGDGNPDLFGVEGSVPDTAHSPQPTAHASESVIADLKTIEDVETDYQVADTPEKAAKLIEELKQRKLFAFDTETSGLNPRESQLVGVSFSWAAHTGWWLPAEQLAVGSGQWAELFSNPEVTIIAHNAKFDIAVLRAFFANRQSSIVNRQFHRIFDTMVAHALIDPTAKHGLNALSEALLSYRPVSIETLIGPKGKDQITMLDADPVALARYAAEDADIAWQLYEKLLPQLKETDQESVFFDIEMPALPAIEAMEAEGVALDLFALEEFSQQLGAKIDTASAEIEKAAGRPFNLNSPKQLGVVLFDELNLGGPKPKKTKTGQYKTDEQTLTALAGTHPIIDNILNYRMMTKLKSTYVDALPNSVSKKTGRIHTSYHQAATTTGRLASSDPNLQNIPIRTELGREIRKAFVADAGKLILSADYSQIELRILGAVSEDPGMIEAFKNGIDIHAATAAKVYGVQPDEVEPEMRRKAKMVNFGISYGISAFGLSQRLGIPRKEAAEIIDNYFTQFPGIKDYIEDTIAFCKENGYVETLSGRRRFLPDVSSSNKTVASAAERNAINMPIQGTAADLIKIAMANIHNDLNEQGFESRMLLQVHDELVFELVPDEEEKLRSILNGRMINALPSLNEKVPVEIEIGTGKNWLEAH
jgi:DNA polymerase-1